VSRAAEYFNVVSSVMRREGEPCVPVRDRKKKKIHRKNADWDGVGAKNEPLAESTSDLAGKELRSPKTRKFH